MRKFGSESWGAWEGYAGGPGRRGGYGPRRSEFGGAGGGPHGVSSRRARRGNVRAAVLALLSERPMHGYQMIQELARRSGGAWTPSPGSIYPTLQMLEDEGLVTSRQSEDGKRLYELTDAGRAEARSSRAGEHHRPWEQPGRGRGAMPFDLVTAIRDTAIALVHAATSATDEQRAQVVALLNEFREKLNAAVPGGPQPGGPWGPWGPPGRPRGPWGRSGPSWPFGLPDWLFGPPPGGPFGPGGFWGRGSEPASEAEGEPGASAGAGEEGDLAGEGEEGDVEV